jgi:hypothetical protein
MMNSDCQLNRIGSKELDPPSHSLLQLVEVRLQLPEVLALRPQRSSERPATGSVAISKTVGAKWMMQQAETSGAQAHTTCPTQQLFRDADEDLMCLDSQG